MKKRPKYENSAIAHLIDEYIHKAKHRDILKDKLINGYTFEQVAEKYDMSVSGVQYIVARSENVLFPHMK